MARTKQTARLCAQYVPRQSGPINPANRSRKRKGGRSRSASSESEGPDVTHQQFSLKFDNQPECERKAIKGPRFECKNCQAILSHYSEL